MDRPRRPVTRAIRERTLARYDSLIASSGAPASATGLDIVRARAFPDPLPSYQGLFTDDRGNTWADWFRLPGDDARPRFDLFGAEGDHRGVVAVPERGQVLDIRDGLLLLLVRDALGVPALQIYRVEVG